MPFLYSLFIFLLGAGSIEFNIAELPAESQEQARLKGFAYQTAAGQWILSPHPGLRSCCVGSAEKAGEQVILSGAFGPLPKGQVITVEGRLSVNPGQERGRYTLEDTTIVTKEAASHWYTTGTALGLLLVIGGYALLTPKKTTN